MTSMPWFRVYGDLMTDRKINRICKKTGQSKALVIGFWICLLALANDSPKRGYLLLADDIPYSIEDYEDETGLPAEIVAQLLDEFRTYRMIDGTGIIKIANWDKRQYKSDNSTERVRRHRAKKRNETLQKRSGNVLDTDTESDTDSEEEKEQNNNNSSVDYEYGALCTVYEKNIGPLTQMLADELADDLKEYGLQTCMDAISEALKNNVRKWSYVRGILRNWKRDGRNGNAPKKEDTDTLYYFDVGNIRQWYQNGELVRTEPIGGEA